MFLYKVGAVFFLVSFPRVAPASANNSRQVRRYSSLKFWKGKTSAYSVALLAISHTDRMFLDIVSIGGAYVCVNKQRNVNRQKIIRQGSHSGQAV